MGYAVARLAGRNKKEKNNNKKKKQNKGETQQGFGEARIVLDYTHLQNEDREELAQNSKLRLKVITSLFFFVEKVQRMADKRHNVRKTLLLLYIRHECHSKRAASLAAGAKESLPPERFNSARRKRQTSQEATRLQHVNI